MSLPGLPPDSLATGPAEVLVGYGGLALSCALAVLALVALLRGRGTWRSCAAIPVGVALAFVSHAWLADNWRSWRHDQCMRGDVAYCATAADARPPLWPF